MQPVLGNTPLDGNRFNFAARKKNHRPLAENANRSFRLILRAQQLDAVFGQEHILLHSVPSMSMCRLPSVSGILCRIASNTPPAIALALSETV